MIGSMCDKRIPAIRAGKSVKGFPSDLIARAQRKLAQLDAASMLPDMSVPPSNNLEALKGDRAGQHSVRTSGQWRLCFIWRDGNAYDVEIVDYH
ncbi:type II toxin-antitoxin system RelE/ParE family toxin [Aliihoeflea aestuarii]|jgi:toxin HigB-1|uniref:type II toxin-antitoxin system RelE/ParE family toxin n=1 Tax=Aliihoeflea aestuarii TaxID=453840 RepID=UPI0020939DF5|nr:type II toxin-antitoxin system RelE/ParE family toxin [Aliihoeflea aestuarii]MCO6389746.1 type II toxin-antitoxin system RelE/ParE family toxin [Aliihoeflea aestuarii]